MNDELLLALGVAGLLVLLTLNAVFVAAEFAFVGVRRTRVEQLAGQGHTRAKLLLSAIRDLDATIAATQLGITMCGLALGWIGEPVLARVIEAAIGGALSWAPAHTTNVLATVLAFLLVTTAVIVFAELAPKTIALAQTERVGMAVAPPVLAFSRVFRPFVWFLHRSGALVVRALGIPRRTAEGESLEPEELELIIEASARAGFLSESELLLARRALEFSEIRADQVMVPRTEVVAIDVTATLDEVLATIERHQHTRYPVYEGDLDHVVGVLDAKRLLPLVARGETAWLPIVRPAVVVPGSVGVDVAIAEMRRNRVQFLVLVDEHGGTAGILTADELLYRLVGRLGGQPGAELIRPLASGNFLLGGLALVADVEDALGVELSDEDYDTVGGFVMAKLGRIPRVGDRLEAAGYEFRVLAMDGRRVDRVLAIRREPRAPAQARREPRR